MNWQEFLPILIVLAVGAIFVWRSSGEQKHEHKCGCACHHEQEPETKKENPAR